jgi:putrescine transport system substrate-binding protein
MEHCRLVALPAGCVALTRMPWRARLGLMLGMVAAVLSGCGKSGQTVDDAQVLNLYTWADYLAPDTLANFEKQTGIKVHVSYFDTNETLEARIMTGNSGFDVVVPTAPYLERQIFSGAYLPLDKSQIPNLGNLDPALVAQVAANDPGNVHSVIYAWGTIGIGYNAKQVAEALPEGPPESWRLVFDPAIASRLAHCGISLIDDPAGIVRLVLKYLGRNTDTPSADDLAAAESLLLEVRPFIRTIDSVSNIEAIANGDICIAVAYNGDFVQAHKRALEAKNGIQVDFLIPKEGTLLWFDMLAIPRNAPHAANAHRFINYILQPRVIADISNFTGFANANAAALALLDPAIAANPTVYPTPAQRRRLFVQKMDSSDESRAITRLWQKFKTAH